MMQAFCLTVTTVKRTVSHGTINRLAGRGDEEACNTGGVRDAGMVPEGGRKEDRDEGKYVKYVATCIVWKEEPDMG